ncbi:MAG: ABC transporter substrate-binding protein [Treponema sp.]|nr:ABC transporter substrate-binding protein [Treponema sp.]
MNKNRIIFFIFLAIFLIFSSCIDNNKNTLLELRYGFTTEPTTLDPLNPRNTADGRSILFNVFEGLVKPNTDGTLSPCIGESWVIEQDGLIYDFIIRENVLFHDGTIVTVQDVKFSLDTAIAAGLNGLGNIDEVIIKSDNEIRIILKTKDPGFLPFLTIAIVKSENTDRENNIIGTGPYFIESYTPQIDLVLKKFNDYWQKGLPHLEKITIVFFANSDTMIVALRGGSIDGASITGSMAAQLNKNDFDIFDNSSAGIHLMALNNTASPFNDIRVRQAVNYGIDVQEIIDAAFFGHGTPSGSPVIPGLSVYYYSILEYSYNPDLARSLLSQAGYNNSNRLSFEIAVPSNYAMHIDTAQVIKSQLERIDINVNIKLVDWSTWLSEVYSAKNYQATIITLDSHTVSPRGFLARYRSDSSGNFINFFNTDYDSVYDAALSHTDHVTRINLYKEAQQIILRNAASVYLQDILYFTALRGGKFGGVLDYPIYIIDFASIHSTREK